MKTNHLFLACIALLMAAVAVSDQRSNGRAGERLRHLINSHGPLVYSALFALPETQAAFLSAAGDEAWSTYSPSELPDLLSPEQKEQVINAAANRIQALSRPDLAKLFKRIRY
jgi:N-acetylglutamate synthase-like GNAT family acetyltransferase